jgi:glycosyltransferase involved in cell wall biosynthesis
LSFFKSKFTKINFCGFLSENDKLKIMKSSDIVFVPTAQEWSLVTIEANLVGTPVIAKYSNAIEEINNIISNSKNQPNLMYNNIEEIDHLIPLAYKGRKVLEKNKLSFTKYFSNARFISELSNNFKEV